MSPSVWTKLSLNVYAERKVYKQSVDGQRRLSFKSLFSPKVNHLSGKSTFTDLLSNSLIEAVKNENGLKMRTGLPTVRWIAKKSPKWTISIYAAGNDRSDGLQLMDPERAGTASARYKDKKVAPRALLINSEKPKDLHWKFSWLPPEAMDQFFARILKLAPYS